MITVALVGLGNISLDFDNNIESSSILSHAKALYKDNRFLLKYCIDINKKNEIKIKDFFPNIIFYTDITNILDKEDIDLVIIATPTNTHFNILKQIAQNAHIQYFLVEKPLFSNNDEFDTLDNEIKKKIIINYIRLFEPNIQLLRDKIKHNKFQNIQKIQLTYTKGIKNNGSHFISLLNFLFNNPTIENIQVLHERKGLQDDPTLDIIAFFKYNDAKIPIYMIGLDHDKYSLFDIDFYFENYKVSIEDSNQKMLISKSIQDETYPEYNILKTTKTIDLNYETIMQYPYNYMYNLMTTNDNLINFIDHEYSNNEFYKNLQEEIEHE